MSTSQTRPRTPPSDYGPSLTPPTLEEINLCHVSIDVEASENKPKGSPPSATEDNVVTSAETEEANGNNNNSGTSNGVGPFGFLIIHLGLLVYAMFMAAVIIILIRLANRSRHHYHKRRAALVTWCIVEFAWRFAGLYFTARQYSVKYTIFNSLGIFLGREYYVAFINSLWPDTASVPSIGWGLKIDDNWLVQGLFYAIFNLIFGIWFWVGTQHAVINSRGSNDYETSLATGGLVSCLVNVISYFLTCICALLASLG